MRDLDKRKDQLINELVEVRRHIAELEASQTERKKAEDALRQSEEKFRSIFENANDLVVYLDKVGTVIDVNDKVEEIFGHKKNEVIGRNFADLAIFTPDDLQRISELFSTAV